MIDQKEPPPKPSETLDPAQATGLQDGVADAIVDFERVAREARLPKPLASSAW